MILKEAVDKILADQKRSLSWLANEMDRTIDGFKLSLVNGSIKYNDIVRLVEVLDVPVTRLFPQRTYIIKETNMLAKEPGIEFQKENQLLKENIEILKGTIKDKEKIIELLSKH